MTAPALPGAAPDPARLPPEVERAIRDYKDAVIRYYTGSTSYGGQSAPAADYMVERGTALRTAIARALGGDGEPVAWGVGSRVVVIGKALNEGHNFVGRTGVVVEPIDHAKARWVRFDGDDNKTSVPMRYLAVATAATGDTTELEADLRRAISLAHKAQSRADKMAADVRAILDRLPCHITYGDSHTKDQRGMCRTCSAKDALGVVLATHRAATGDHPSEARRGHESEGRGGPDAR